MPEPLPPVAERFLRYVQIDTQSDFEAETTPSTEKQKDLSRLLVQELQAMGYKDAEMDECGYVFATVPSRLPGAAEGPVVALLAHVDTSPDAPGAGVKPQVHRAWDGTPIALAGNPSVVLDPAERPALVEHVGHDLLTSDGTTLLGSDDKAGVALIMQLAEDLLHDEAPRPTLRLCFTVDEEIGRGVNKLDLDRLGADVAYTLDGSGTGTLQAETFNAAEATITIAGVMVHPGYAKGIMANAVRILAELLAALPAGEAPETTSGREGYLHPTRFGGDATRAEAHLILRDFEANGLARRKRLLDTLCETARQKHPRAKISLDVCDQYKNMRRYIKEQDERALTFAFRAAERCGQPLRYELIRGGTDGARLSEQGLPTPNVFTGGHDFHSVFEWNTVQNLERALTFTKALVQVWGEDG